MVDNKTKKPPGRPRSFEPTEALDKAVEMFWADGYDGVDVERIAKAVGVTKPSLYRVFGDKPSLFLHALKRYGQTIGAEALIAFHSKPEIKEAVQALLEASVNAGTVERLPKGCFIACVAIAEAERSPEIRKAINGAFVALTGTLKIRFEKEIQLGKLAPFPSAEARSRLLVDLTQGLLVRARAGVTRKQLLRDARNYGSFILK